MKILNCQSDTKTEPWLQGLRAALPGAEIVDWTPGAPLADYAVVWAPPQQMLDEQTQLKALFNTGAGVDKLMSLKIRPEVAVVRLEDAGMGVQMVEYVLYAVTRHFRELGAYEEAQSEARWSYRKPLRRASYPIGVLGLGVLGQQVAQGLAAFQYAVNGWSRTPRDVPGIRCFHGDQGLQAFLAASRFLVCLLPLTPETNGMLNRDTLSRLQPGGYLINVARGGHLVDQDLLDLLESGHLAGATLDVFHTEPLPAEHPFWRHPKISVTPHTSARTLRDETIAQIAGKLLALAAGAPVSTLGGVVDRQRGY
jgi:glyoxylate/hydroxypyruvate reductase A